MTQYDMERWAEATTRGRRVFSYRFRLFGHELKGWILLKSVAVLQREDHWETAYLVQDPEDPRRLVRIRIDELDSWRSAHKQLLVSLEHCMRRSIPAGTGDLASVGDINRVAREPRTDVAGAVLFTRGNLSVSVNSAGEQNVDVSRIAVALDRVMGDAPTESSRARRVPPRIVAARTGLPRPLIARLSRTTPQGAWLKVIAPDGELMRVGDRLLYAAAKGGAKRIGTFVMKGPSTRTQR